jgi:hypothetical protein
MSKSYPSFTPNNDLIYKVGSFSHIVPPFLPDTAMIRPFGEYGMATYGVYTKISGGYWLNVNSEIGDNRYDIGADIAYLVTQELKLLPHIKKVVIAIHWYTSNDDGNVAVNNIVPAIGPEVQAWNWKNAPPAEYIVYPWTRANAYYLRNTHQLWPTPDDNALINGIQYLQSMGYEVGICPMATLMSSQYYFANGGEWEIDRINKTWKVADQTKFTSYLNAYQTFYHHYIDLMAQYNIRPWIMYLGYAMRDITGCGVQPFLIQFVKLIHDLSEYCKSKLPHTLTTYAADLDEYYYPYLVRGTFNSLDPLWTCPAIDLVGINWFAPLCINDTEDLVTLQKGVFQGEGYNFYLPNLSWRSGLSDRLISNTTRNFKTGLAQSPINPRVNGMKDLQEWLTFLHFYPAIPGVLAGCTPLPNLFPGNPRLCSHIYGTGKIQTDIPALTPTVGGLAPPINDLENTWVLVQRHSYMSLNFPDQVDDPNSIFNFEFNFEIDPVLTNLSGNYRLTDSSYGLKIDSINGTITLWLPKITGAFLQVPLFYAAKGIITLVYTPTSVKISVDHAYDLTVTTNLVTAFKLPYRGDNMWIGNPQKPADGKLPSGYGVWQGKVKYLSIVIGETADNQSGGRFYFDDAYCGIRTAWTPSLKPWMATSFGYSSVRGSAVDPQTRVQVILSPYPTRVPNWFEEYDQVKYGIFHGNWKVWDIQGPYGSDFAIDDIYQAIVMYAASLALIEADAKHQVAWFFDTRSPAAYLALNAPRNIQIFNDGLNCAINSMLNGKAAVRSGGSTLVFGAAETVSEDLGLSIVPGPLPYEKVIVVEQGVPQV